MGDRTAGLIARIGLFLLAAVSVGETAPGQQALSAAPTILQSVVLHPCAEAGACGAARGAIESVIPPARSSGSMSGRLAMGDRAPGTTAYKSDPAVSAAVRRAFVGSLAQRLNRQAADAIARNMEENDPVARWSAMVGPEGLRTGDFADALASYWVLNWAMANGGESSGAAMQAVREQVRWAVANQPALERLSNAEKQAMAEEAMLNFVYEVTGYLQARQARNGAVLERIAEGAERRFRSEMAIDLRSLSLTEQGLTARRQR